MTLLSTNQLKAIVLAEDVAAVLEGGGWTHQPAANLGADTYLLGPGGLRLKVAVARGRATFTAQPPAGRCTWPHRAISVRADRGNHVIARQLATRLLPGYRAAYGLAQAEALQDARDDAAAETGREATLARLRAVAPTDRYREIRSATGASATWWAGVDPGPHGRGAIHVNWDGGDVELLLRSLTAEAAERVLRALTDSPQQ